MEQLSCGMTPDEVAAEAAEADAEEAERQRPFREAEEAYLATLTKHARYYQTHKAQRLAETALGRAGPAAPPWLPKEQKAQMVAIYQQALWLEKMWGQKFEGDHMVPLHASHKGIHYYCGLHVPWNLGAVTGEYNGDKSDRWPTCDPLIGEDDLPSDWVTFTTDDSDDEFPF